MWPTLFCRYYPLVVFPLELWIFVGNHDLWRVQPGSSLVFVLWLPMFALPTHIFYPVLIIRCFQQTSPKACHFLHVVDNALIKCESGTASPDLCFYRRKNDGSSFAYCVPVGIGTYQLWAALRGVVGTFNSISHPIDLIWFNLTQCCIFYSAIQWLHCSKPYLHQTLKCRSVASNPVMLAQIFNWQGFFVCIRLALNLFTEYKLKRACWQLSPLCFDIWSLCYLWW